PVYLIFSLRILFHILNLKMKNSQEKDEEPEPTVESEDIQERIQARRLRIERRIEAQRRAEGTDEEEGVKIEELSKSLKQIEASRQRNTKLLRDGNEFLTNVRVAGDARENARRIEDDEARRLRREKLEAEAKAATEKFDDITKKWEIALQKEIPQDLHEMLQAQQEGCDSLIDEKNKLINELLFELKAKDELYVKELKKQSEEIDLLVERMEEQVRTMTRAYKQELLQIEKAFVQQREDTMERQTSDWEALMKQIVDRQNEYLQARQLRVDDFEDQLSALRTQHAEEFNELKVTLEQDVERLQQQVQMMKATFQLNLEKLEYNFQVLKKREEDNTQTKSLQKRRITRLQDALNNLRVKLRKQEKDFKQQNEQLTEDYRRVTEQFRDLMKKAKNLLGADGKKFHDIWLMNEEEAKKLAERLLDADRVLHEQQLGIPWTEPDCSFLDNVGPVVSASDRAKSVPVAQVVRDMLSREGGDAPGLEQLGSVDEARSLAARELNPSIVRSVLELVCDEAGFLIEKKLKTLLAPLEKDERNLMQLDAVFSALGITSEDEIDKMLPYFLQDSGAIDEEDEPEEEEGAVGGGGSEAGSGEEAAEEIRRIVSPKDGSRVTLIHPNRVRRALRGFVQELQRSHQQRQHQSQGGGQQFTLKDIEERDDSEDAAYWARYGSLIDEDKEALWDALLAGMEKYSSVLQSRSSLLNETDALRLQNAELRHLLQQYVTSKVNQELEIPPTQVMQLDRLG
ncbi:hypothetical protein BOX15_Mlig033113g3, partial [Macrostomum lignano]